LYSPQANPENPKDAYWTQMCNDKHYVSGRPQLAIASVGKKDATLEIHKNLMVENPCGNFFAL